MSKTIGWKWRNSISLLTILIVYTFLVGLVGRYYNHWGKVFSLGTYRFTSAGALLLGIVFSVFMGLNYVLLRMLTERSKLDSFLISVVVTLVQLAIFAGPVYKMCKGF